MNRNKSLIRKNLTYSIGTKIITILMGIILPRLLIVSYGSEINGLLATVTQIFTYMALLEAGIGNSAINALYRPLEVKDFEEANEIVSQARTYYRRVSILYGLCIILFAVTYPTLTNSRISKSLIVGIILFQGSANFINYYFTAVYNQLLTADGRRYVTENLTFIAYILNSSIKIILIMMGCNVIVVQVGFFFVSLIKAPITIYYCKKKYSWLKLYKTKSLNGLHERSAFIIHEISNTIFNNTDVIIVSTFCGLTLTSVYTVYNLIFSSLTSLLATAYTGLGFILGQNQHKDKDVLEETYDVYSSIYSCATFVIFTIAYLLITPFIFLYTQGVSDIDYLLPGLPILFTVINLLSGVRATGALLITVSGNAEATKKRSIIEAAINLFCSIIFVNYFGIWGVLYGTIVALLYRTNDIIIYANRNILGRSPWKEYQNIGSLVGGFMIIFVINKNISANISSYGLFILYGMAYAILTTCVYVTITLIGNHRVMKIMYDTIKDKKKQFVRFKMR